MKTQVLTLCSLLALGSTTAFLPPMLQAPPSLSKGLTRFAENETLESKYTATAFKCVKCMFRYINNYIYIDR